MRSIKWGIIGAGDIVRKRVAPAIKAIEDCELYAVTRGRADLAQAFAEEFDIPHYYSNWREMLADKNIDAIYIATPVFLHAEQTIAAANSGKHVLCEKPMALTVAECDQMIDVCASNNVKLGIAYYRRFYPVLERVRRLLASGEIGTPVTAQMNAFEYVDITSEAERVWLLDKRKSGGGPMMDFGCHRIEVLTDLFGDVSDLRSIVTNVVFTERDVEDTAAALFKFEAGSTATLTVTHAAREAQDTLDIFCTKGSIHIENLNKGSLRLITSAGESIEHHPPHINIHQPLIQDFADAIRSDREPIVNAETGKNVSEILESIYSVE